MSACGDRSYLLKDRRILVVEDDFMVAEVLCDMLAEMGATVVGPIGWLADALAFVDDHASAFDSAILDLNLHGENTYGLARVLRERGVWFVFSTGYGSEAVEREFRTYPRCEKPVCLNDLVQAFRSA